MKFEFSPFVAFQVKDYERAVKFYKEVMGMKPVRAGVGETELTCGPVTFYVEPGKPRNVFLEFKTDDLVGAKRAFAEAGCRLEPTTTPEGRESCFVYDPYGLVFHLWQEPA